MVPGKTEIVPALDTGATTIGTGVLRGRSNAAPNVAVRNSHLA